MSKTTIRNPEDAFLLPKGRLVLSIIESSFSRENVYETAQILIAQNDAADLKTQADVITRAGNKYGWGLGAGYLAIDGSAGSDATLPPEKSTIVNLATARDALRLVQGELAVPPFPVRICETAVLEAAQVLIDNDDGTALVSQAGVIARAGKHGYGMGDKYKVVG